MSQTDDTLRAEVRRRRTFAIISHPDAGKTTLTEKLLLYGGAIHIAGAVKQKRAARHASSDWMAIEKERGISISTSVMQFEHRGHHFNLLDTPGHNDFSEDTYRTLAATDCAVMLIDSVKGVEPQTIKLFEVCRLRKIPIVTFVNKMDRYGKGPLELLSEIEEVLGIPCTPITWPVASGPEFQGVFDRITREFFHFERASESGQRAPMSLADITDPALRETIGDQAHAQLMSEIELLDAAGNPFDREQFLAGTLTPVFFGSAMTNFGVETFLDRFIDLAPAPRVRATLNGDLEPDRPHFSGFVFKIQANMDPNHRDRIAFVRVCSGRFRRGMEVFHPRTSKRFVVSRSLNFLAQERTVVDESISGDILGVWDPGMLRIGDSLTEGDVIEFDGIPRFSPGNFVRVRLSSPMKRKQLKKGIEQLADEGAVLLLNADAESETDPILGAVGQLQFDVVQYRLKAEYGVDARFEQLPFQQARWVVGDSFNAQDFQHNTSILCLYDLEKRPILLFESEWIRRRTEDKYPKLTFIAAAQPGRLTRS